MAITLSGSAGSAVSMLGITGAVGGTLTLYDPTGMQVATGYAIPFYPCPDEEPPGTCPQVLIAPVTIPLTGTYAVYFAPDAGDSGPLAVWVTGVSNGLVGDRHLHVVHRCGGEPERHLQPPGTVISMT